jgi:hypothetical protein
MKAISLALLFILAPAGCTGRPPGGTVSGKQPQARPAADAASEAAASDAGSAGDEQRTQVIAIVVGYLTGVLHYDYADGSSESFDGTELKILSPERLAGQPLFIYHFEPVADQGSLWKKAGAKIRFLLPADNLEPPEGTSYDIYSSGITPEEMK